MQILNPDLLAQFQLAGRCEWCGKWGPREPHHYFFRKGMGGGGQIDHPYNLVALCRICHDDAHWGRMTKWDFLAVVSAREGKMQDRVEEELYRIRRS